MPSSNAEFDSTEYGSGKTARRRLADLCTDAFFLIFHIRSGKDPGHPDNLRKEAGLMSEDIDKQGRKLGYSEEDIKATRYALVALIDETVLNSQWPFKDQWSDRPLQLEFFGEHMAGERFFDLLERVRQKGSRKVDLLEVFAVVLILGFQGKYKLSGRDELEKLTRELVGEVTKYRGGIPLLSPHARIPEEPVERPSNAVPRWVWVSGLSAIVLVILVFIVLKLFLVSSAGEAAQRMFL
jgi:type VI secretion system protein ImpK